MLTTVAISNFCSLYEYDLDVFEKILLIEDKMYPHIVESLKNNDEGDAGKKG